jgi:cyclopropane fatty-acyl-phospholipid synthase-like methyltransferase
MGITLEYQTILEWVRQGASVLDLGCGDGELLSLLVRAKNVGWALRLTTGHLSMCRQDLRISRDIDNGLQNMGTNLSIM